MPAVGEPFRDFAIGAFDSRKVRKAQPLVVIVWKIGCETSRMTLPFFDRLQDAYPDAEIVGIAQETAQDMGDYVLEQGIGFGQLADEGLLVTRQFEVDYVPAYWLTDSSGKVIEGGGAWDKSRIEAIGKELARLTGVKAKGIFKASDAVPNFKPG